MTGRLADQVAAAARPIEKREPRPAQAACDYLHTIGFHVPMVVHGYSTQHPLVRNDTIANELRNRRLEIVVMR